MTQRQDLLLNRAMLSVHKTPYVGRFARDWHRLATTACPQPPVFYAVSDEAFELKRLRERDSATPGELLPEAVVGAGFHAPYGPQI